MAAPVYCLAESRAAKLRATSISPASVTPYCVSALGSSRHLLGCEPVAIHRAHVDEPRVARGSVLRRMVTDGGEAALQVDGRRTGLELALERIDGDFGVGLCAVRVVHPRRVVVEQLAAKIAIYPFKREFQSGS